MSYEPKPGTLAFRALAHLQAMAPGTELMTSQLAELMGTTGERLFGALEPALAAGTVHRRQRVPGPRAPYWWSMTPQSAPPERIDVLLHQAPADEPITIPTFTSNRITQEPDTRQVLKAEPATADATDRGALVMASPRVGAMGAGQPADAGPAGSDPEVAWAIAGDFSCALWSDGWLDLRGLSVTGMGMARLSPDETRQLLAYLDRTREVAA